MRAIFELPVLAFVREMVAWREARAEARFVGDACRQLGLAPLIPSQFDLALGEDIGETLFVLGSGASVERLGELEWAKVRANTSIGINSWVLHDFVPDVYAYEPAAAAGPGHVRLMSLLERKDIVERSPWILSLKPRTRFEQDQLEQIPEELLPKTFLYGRFQPSTRRVSNLPSELSRLLERCESGRHPVLPDSGASIVRMAALGIVMRFEQIVFVGVDLNASPYFWEANPFHLMRNGLTEFPHLQTPGGHETLNPDNRAFAVKEMINALQECGAQFGTRLFVESQDSALADVLDVYEWDENA